MIAEAHAQVERRFAAEEIVHLRIVERLQGLHHSVLWSLGLQKLGRIIINN